MNKIVRKSLVAIVGLLAFVLLLFAGIAIYIASNNAALKGRLSEKIQERTRGQVVIGKVSPAFLSTFPFLSIEIDNLTLRDSAYSRHKVDMLRVKKAYLRISLFRILSDVMFDRVILENGQINLFRDHTGFNNTYVFKTANKESEGEPSQKPSAAAYPAVEMRSVMIDFRNPSRNKHHRIFAKELVATIRNKKNLLWINASTNLKIDHIAFNTEKGGFLYNTNWQSKLELRYSKQLRRLDFKDQSVSLNGRPYILSGEFHTHPEKPQFKLQIRAPKTTYSDCASLLPKKIGDKVRKYAIAGPVAVVADISGLTRQGSKPLVSVKLIANNNDVQSPFVSLTNCNFTATFSNQLHQSLGRNDSNSVVRILSLRGRLGAIPIRMDSIVIADLIKPKIKAVLISDLNLTDLNEHSGSETLKFTAGTASIRLFYDGPVEETVINPSLYGNISFNNADIIYLPRDFRMLNARGRIELARNHLSVKSLSLSTGKSQISMDGYAENFLSLLNVSPESLLLKWNIRTPHLFLEDYRAFLSKRRVSDRKQRNEALFKSTSSKVDKMLVDGRVQLSLTAHKMNYKKFDANDVQAYVELTSNEANVREVSMNHANGRMRLQGQMQEGTGQDNSNKVLIKADLENLDLPILFNSFSNFGQDAIEARNIAGRVSALANITTNITDKATVLRDNTKGTIDFLVQKFELNNFEPIQKIAEKVFKKQDFKNIRFADLENRLMVDGTAISFDRMEIRSTAITMFVKGVYDVRKGTDMSITLPVRNLLKSNAGVELSDEGKSQKGLSIRLRAKTGDDGKLKIGWDPLRRGGG